MIKKICVFSLKQSLWWDYGESESLLWVCQNEIMVIGESVFLRERCAYYWTFEEMKVVVLRTVRRHKNEQTCACQNQFHNYFEVKVCFCQSSTFTPPSAIHDQAVSSNEKSMHVWFGLTGSKLLRSWISDCSWVLCTKTHSHWTHFKS